MCHKNLDVSAKITVSGFSCSFSLYLMVFFYATDLLVSSPDHVTGSCMLHGSENLTSAL